MKRLARNVHDELLNCINHRLRIGSDRLILRANGLDEMTNIDHEHNEDAICNAHLLHVD